MKGRTWWGVGGGPVEIILNVFDNWYIIDDRKKTRALQANSKT